MSKDTPTMLSDKKAQPNTAYPLVKWPGGKRRLVAEIRALFPDQPINTLWEPFCGGAAVFLHCHRELVVGGELSDVNSRLIGTYKSVKAEPDKVNEALFALAEQHCEKAYYDARKRFNEGLEGADLAAYFIYLNRTGFNGLYRENSRGNFNVPYGHREFTWDANNITAVGEALQNCRLAVRDFNDISSDAQDVVYCDPPYHDTFTNYASGGFSQAEQERLVESCRMWAATGATVIVSNSLSAYTRELYDGFDIVPVTAHRSISRDGANRRVERELLGVIR